MKFITRIFVLVGFAAMMSANGALAKEPRPSIEFRNDIVPLLTKHGCNAGACHGAAIGRGGFKLSLYGGNPRADYDAIVRQVGGRRVNLARPDRSLIVLKPTEHVSHGGGTLFNIDSTASQLLIDWVKQGAQQASARRITRVEISPRRHIGKTTGKPIKIQTVAHYSDGTKRDTSAWTVLTAEDSAAVKVDGKSNTLTVHRPGRHIVVARYLDYVVPIELMVPLTTNAVDLSKHSRQNFIDNEVLASLTVLGLRPSATIDDRAFLRRVTLDLTGRLPTPELAAQFDKDSSSGKRQRLIDQLLQSEEFTEYWTLQFAKLLRVRPRDGDRRAAQAYHSWLREQVRRDASYQKLAQALILAEGNTSQFGPANFYRTTKDPREQAEFFSELLMGSRLRCANCHNHPLDRWTQDDYHGLAAIFAKVEFGPIIRPKPAGFVIHPRTLAAATAQIPGKSPLTGKDNARRQLADWLTHPKNPYFAKAIVNRLWRRMLGRGLVEPPDDFRATNPATHPQLLDKLAADFIAHDYRLRHTLGIIANSDTYARSANATKQNKADDRFYSHALRRRLEPEVLADAISDVLGVADKYGTEPLGTRAVALVSPSTTSRTLDVLGRCNRQGSCEESERASGGLTQKLHLFNGPLLNARISSTNSRLSRSLKARRKPLKIINEFYLAAFNRSPTAAEETHWQQQLAVAKDQQQFLEDFVWGLLTSQEFVTNH